MIVSHRHNRAYVSEKYMYVHERSLPPRNESAEVAAFPAKITAGATGSKLSDEQMEDAAASQRMTTEG